MDVRDAPTGPAVDIPERVACEVLILEAGMGIPERTLFAGSAVGCSVWRRSMVFAGRETK